jgi:hypothetical protein
MWALLGALAIGVWWAWHLHLVSLKRGATSRFPTEPLKYTPLTEKERRALDSEGW